MQSIPSHTCVDHVVPCCYASDLHALSAASRGVLQYLREIGAFSALDRCGIAPLNGGDGDSAGRSALTKGPQDEALAERRVRACAPALRWLGNGFDSGAFPRGGGEKKSDSAGSHEYRLSDIGGRPRHPRDQCLPSQGRVRSLTGLHASGKRLVALASPEDQRAGAAPIRVWLQIESVGNPSKGSGGKVEATERVGGAASGRAVAARVRGRRRRRKTTITRGAPMSAVRCVRRPKTLTSLQPCFLPASPRGRCTSLICARTSTSLSARCRSNCTPPTSTPTLLCRSSLQPNRRNSWFATAFSTLYLTSSSCPTGQGR